MENPKRLFNPNSSFWMWNSHCRGYHHSCLEFGWWRLTIDFWSESCPHWTTLLLDAWVRKSALLFQFGTVLKIHPNSFWQPLHLFPSFPHRSSSWDLFSISLLLNILWEMPPCKPKSRMDKALLLNRVGKRLCKEADSHKSMALSYCMVLAMFFQLSHSCVKGASDYIK